MARGCLMVDGVVPGKTRREMHSMLRGRRRRSFLLGRPIRAGGAHVQAGGSLNGYVEAGRGAAASPFLKRAPKHEQGANGVQLVGAASEV